MNGNIIYFKDCVDILKGNIQFIIMSKCKQSVVTTALNFLGFNIICNHPDEKVECEKCGVVKNCQIFCGQPKDPTLKKMCKECWKLTNNEKRKEQLSLMEQLIDEWKK